MTLPIIILYLMYIFLQMGNVHGSGPMDLADSDGMIGDDPSALTRGQHASDPAVGSQQRAKRANKQPPPSKVSQSVQLKHIRFSDIIYPRILSM